VLLATRGRPKRISKSVRRLIVAPKRAHSQKPDEIYPRIEALVSGPYCELFARQTRPGWYSFGREVETGIGARRWHADARELREANTNTPARDAAE
jgi:N6-adenosine-specific RNA methylase IME4